MTKAEFDTVEVGDVILCNSGMTAIIVDITDNVVKYAAPKETGAKIHSSPITEFGYASHISKGTTYGTHRTLRHKADFKTKP